MQYLEPEIFMEPENHPKRAGRPPIGEGTKLGLRIRPELEGAIDTWMAKQDDPSLTKPEAIRRLLWKALRQDVREAAP
jgi:hypothetical protein